MPHQVSTGARQPGIATKSRNPDCGCPFPPESAAAWRIIAKRGAKVAGATRPALAYCCDPKQGGCAVETVTVARAGMTRSTTASAANYAFGMALLTRIQLRQRVPCFAAVSAFDTARGPGTDGD